MCFQWSNNFLDKLIKSLLIIQLIDFQMIDVVMDKYDPLMMFSLGQQILSYGRIVGIPKLFDMIASILTQFYQLIFYQIVSILN